MRKSELFSNVLCAEGGEVGFAHSQGDGHELLALVGDLVLVSSKIANSTTDAVPFNALLCVLL
jgi:hypothetical protein